jgi:DNA polymerase
MSLDLDVRQRAMLAEMGVKVWQPEPALETEPDAVPQPAAAPLARPRADSPASVARPSIPVAAAPAPVRQVTPESIAKSDPSTLGSGPKSIKTAVSAGPAGVDALDWDALQAAVAACQACPLAQGRRNTVFGTGDRHADWMVVGEAPGEQEDLQGQPFVGPSGQLLDNMLKAIGLSRHAGVPVAGAAAAEAAPVSAGLQGVYIANVVKCRPPGNRNPQPEEVAQCDPFLARQVALVQPRIILAMGRFAVQSLLGTTEPLGRLRGRVHRYQGVPVVVTYHPAYLLRNLAEKAKAWADLCLALEVMRQDGPAG